ncbi:hypothetical protein D3C76_1011050 [compost metagenome]
MSTKHPKLLEWLKSASDDEITKTETTRDYLRQIGYGNKSASVAMAVCIELSTDGLVTRRELRPHDWARYWPELVPNPFPKATAMEGCR